MYIPTKVFATALFVVLLMTTPARAGPIDDVKSIVSSISGRVNTILGHVDDIPGIATRLKTSAALLSTNVQAIIDDAVADLQELSKSIVEEINADKAERTAFVDGPQGQLFRLRIINLLNEFDVLFNNLTQVAPGTIPEVDFNPLIKLVERIPLRVLWPVYKITRSFDFISDDILMELRQVNDALAVAIPLFTEAVEPESTELRASRWRASFLWRPRLSSSDLTAAEVRADKDDVRKKRNKVKVLKRAGIVLTYVGKLEANIAKYKPEIKKKAAVWGWVGVIIGDKYGEAIGGSIEMAGDIVGKIADFADKKLNETDAELNTQSLRLTIDAFVTATVPLVYPDDAFEDGVDTYVYSDLELSTWATLTRLNELHGVVQPAADVGSSELPSGGRRRRR
jgi:hypothetical protein